jgi:large subunit ribosomal protein L20
MPRVKRGPHRKDKRKRVLKRAKGFYGKKKNAYRIAMQAVDRALKYAYRDRRQKKRQFRSLWIVRINAAARENGLTYNRLISGLRKAGIELNRKILSEIAIHDADGFAAIVEVAKDALEGDPSVKIREATERSARPTPKTPAEKTEKADKAAAPAEPKKKAAPKPEKASKKKEEPRPEPETAEEAPAPKKAEEKKPAAEAKAAPAGEAPTKEELEGMTVDELHALAETRDVAESDIEGSGANGGVVKADWVRVLQGLDHMHVGELEHMAARRGVEKDSIEGSGANGNVVKADWVKALSE